MTPDEVQKLEMTNEDRTKEFESKFVGENCKYGIGYLIWKLIEPWLFKHFKAKDAEWQSHFNEMEKKWKKELEMNNERWEATEKRIGKKLDEIILDLKKM